MLGNVGKLVNKLRRQTINDKSTEDELLSDPNDRPKEKLQLRKSARLNPQKSTLHDSGTESDDEELERLESEGCTDSSMRSYNDFLNGRSPPNIMSSPPLPSEIDTESWDSTGGESGIAPGYESNECSNDSTECTTPNGCENVRRGAFQRTSFTKSQCEFPPMSMHNTGEKRRYSMTGQKTDQPIASRLRSNNESPREIIVAARRTPVKLIIHKPVGQSKPINIPKKSEDDNNALSPQHPVAKRGRTNTYGRPALDLDKMLEHRFSSDSFIPITDAIDENLTQKSDWSLPACQHGSPQVPCAQPDCHFRPVFFDEKNEPRAL